MKKETNSNDGHAQQNPAQHILDPQIRAIVDRPPSRTDPNGSYTGRPEDPREMPQQDADDL